MIDFDGKVKEGQDPANSLLPQIDNNKYCIYERILNMGANTEDMSFIESVW